MAMLWFKVWVTGEAAQTTPDKLKTVKAMSRKTLYFNGLRERCMLLS
ncbi:MAG: hypothetical protein ACRETL_10540 [Gammaproteobacteria bacterium]